jgi:pimeloyl-[acyl-carrier protein] methyl ester esterase
MSLHVETIGAGADLVLLHGWGLHGGMWGPWIEELAGCARLHLVDLPGHGRSAWSLAGPGGLAGLAQAVLARVPQGAALLGWSLGGMVALEIARRHAHRLRALLLVAATPKFVAGPDWEHGMPVPVLEAFSRDLAGDYRGTVQNFLALQARGDEHARATLRLLRARLGAHGEPDPRALAAGLEVLRSTDLRDALPRIAMPALVIAGEHDRLTPPGAGHALAAALPMARLRLVARSGHAPFLSHPGEVLAEVRGFLQRHDAGGAT